MTEDIARKPPVTLRGIRTRQALVDAARVVFERDGYLDARLTDIRAEAKCATGTFYTYFVDKQEIFAAVMEATKNEMLHPAVAVTKQVARATVDWSWQQGSPHWWPARSPHPSRRVVADGEAMRGDGGAANQSPSTTQGLPLQNAKDEWT